MKGPWVIRDLSAAASPSAGLPGIPVHAACVVLIALALAAGTCASAAAQTILLRAGHVIDPGSGTVTEGQEILVRDGVIVEVGEEVDVDESDGVDRVVDLSDSWVLPGLMDCHVHLTANWPYRRPALHRMYVTESDAFRALRGARNAELFLRGGFTTVKEIGNDGDYATADVIEAIRRGWVQGPHIVYAGKILQPYGAFDFGASPRHEGFWAYEFIDADTHDEIRKAIRRNLNRGATAIKMVDGDSPGENDYFYSEADIAFAVEEARRSDVKVTVHTGEGQAARNVILGGAAAVEHGFGLNEELLRLMREEGTFLVGTDFHFDNWYAYGRDSASARASYETVRDRLALAHRLGVEMAWGTDVVIDLPGMNRLESSLRVLETWKDAGVPPMDVLRAMTANAAELLGVADERGRLEAGYEADIVALSRNPLDDISHVETVRFVMKDGAIVRSDP